MAHLSLALLGAFQTECDSQPVAGFESNKVRALLAYLALEADRPHRRELLAGLLWPELPDTVARTNLRQALSNLREAIGDMTATPPFLLITRDTIQFNPASDYDLDIATFAALLAACETHAHRHLARCRSCATRMAQAIALYRGDFLAGFAPGGSAPFEEWQLRWRERLHQRVLDALVQLADYHERRGEDESARRYAQRQIELDPWREEAHRQLMRLLARGHQRSAALAQYETCRSTLARDLGVEPEAETTALYERIRDSKLKIENEELKNTDTQRFSIFNSQFSISRHNFPAQTTRLIGRESELAELGALLENPAHRLITISGPGGIGKTRLALAAAVEQAEAFTHGAAFVPLQAISSAAFVAPAILGGLAVTLQGQRDPREQLLDYLREKELLLVLDNVEQLLMPNQAQYDDAVTLLADILAHAPRVTLLATSRERLALPGEWLFDLSGLSYPASEMDSDIQSYDAVRLFVQRAGQVRRQYVLDGEARAVARICRLVEGLPLAIELAAAARRSRSCAAIADALETSMSTLTTNLRAIPERHRSIRATFEHSWRLLSDEERQIFPRLSVFRGGFEADAATQVAEASPHILAALLDKSLLRWDSAAHYTMLETIREYAAERLEASGEVEAFQWRHAAYYLALAEQAEAKLFGAEQRAWHERLTVELGNLRAALARGLDTDLGLRLAGALFRFWWVRGLIGEGRRWLEQALQRCPNAPAATRAKALYVAGMLASLHGDMQARELIETSLALAREAGDQRRIAYALAGLACQAVDEGNYTLASAHVEESKALFEQEGDTWGLALAWNVHGYIADQRDDEAEIRSSAETTLTLFGRAGDPWFGAGSLIRLGDIALRHGNYHAARSHFEQALALWRELQDSVGMIWGLQKLAAVARELHEDARATALFKESLELQYELGVLADAAPCLAALAGLATAQGQPERAARLFGAVQTLLESTGKTLSPADRAVYEHDLAIAMAQLGNATLAGQWSKGRSMTLEQAIAEALDR